MPAKVGRVTIDDADPTARPLIDGDRLKPFRRDPVEWAEIVATYDDYTSSLLGPLEQSMEDGASPAVVRHVHQLKGCSANLGLVAVVALCEDIEDAARRDALGSLVDAPKRLRELIALSLVALR
jgi:HPt (histidine-containing phosphotransfer) domain-containing protein